MKKRAQWVIVGIVGLSGCVLFEDVTVDNADVDTADEMDSATDEMDSVTDEQDSVYEGLDYWEDDAYCPTSESGDEQIVSNDCRGIVYEGCCDGVGNVLYCHDNFLYCKPCAPQYVCSWKTDDDEEDEDYYWCMDETSSSDPSGAFPRLCEWVVDTDTDAVVDTDTDAVVDTDSDTDM